MAFGPAVGSDTVGKLTAVALMTVFALLGGATVGTEVIATMGGHIVPSGQCPLLASVTVLFFVGLALLSRISLASPPRSMTAVGAIAGLGVVSGDGAVSVNALAADHERGVGAPEPGEVASIGEVDRRRRRPRRTCSTPLRPVGW